MKLKNNLKNRKSQITVFMIIGIVILIIFGLVFYVVNYAAKKEAGGESELTEEQIKEINPIQNYVTFCLDKVAADALQLLGKQGGRIFKSQGGTEKDYRADEVGEFYVKDGSYIIPYAIMPLKISIGTTYFANPPDYPWPDYSGDPHTGMFGEDNFPPLYKNQGSHSLQRQLEAHINDHIRNCTDFSVFQPQGFDIAAKAPNTSTIIGKKDVSVNLNFPLEITKTATGQKVKISKFNSNQKVRLKVIYDLATSLINSDITDISFKLENALRDGMQIGIVGDYYSKDDLISIMDTQSKIWNEPYIMRFARKNRMPALHKIENPTATFNVDDVIETQDDKIEIKRGTDVIATIGSFEADDPDEDTISFVYYKNNIAYPLQSTYAITDTDKNNGLSILVNATDGELSDYQLIALTIS